MSRLKNAVDLFRYVSPINNMKNVLLVVSILLMAYTFAFIQLQPTAIRTCECRTAIRNAEDVMAESLKNAPGKNNDIGDDEENDNKDENGEEMEPMADDDTMAPEMNRHVNFSIFLNITKSLHLYKEYLRVNEFFRPWKFNVKRARDFRIELNGDTDMARKLFLMQGVVSPYDIFSYTKAYWNKFKISKDMYSEFPTEMPRSLKNLRKCSVVGPLYMLRNTSCGSKVDDADFVFRYTYNYPRAFAEDIGKKSNMTLIGRSVFDGRYGSLKKEDDRLNFHRNMTATDGIIVIPMGTSGEATLGLQAIHYASNRTLFFNPDGYKAIKRFLNKKYNFTRKLSTGMYVSMVAMSLCHEVHIYGAWPYRKDFKGNPLPFFFIDDSNSIYNFGEYKLLRNLHENGTLRLHLGSCT